MSISPARWALASALVATAAFTVLFGACGKQTVTVATRSLERSGRTSFVCLAAPGLPQIALPLTACNGTQADTISEYDFVPDAGLATIRIPHLYALVTQTARGEVAVIDLSSRNSQVLDENPGIPGANFLPIGASPIDIVSTPGGTATFVGVAEIGRPALFALPSSQIRPDSADYSADGGIPGTGGNGGGIVAPPSKPALELSSWPACVLPSAPGAMLLLEDPAVGGLERSTCDAPYGVAAAPGALHAEGHGRQKLVVAMPDIGGIAVFDAQALLDREPGSFAPCVVERWLPLATAVPAYEPTPAPTGPACVNPTAKKPAYAANYPSRPSGLSYAAGRLYVSDLDAPVIHVIDLVSPCAPVELEPLLPTSTEDAERVVFTSHLSVAKSATAKLERFLYAIDAQDGSAIVFDVSSDASPRFPLQRKHSDWDPLHPRDRVRYAAPAADIILIDHDIPQSNPATGVAVAGTRCSPNPAAVACIQTSQSCDPGTLYRTSAAYDSGAGPVALRGSFAFMALTNGTVGVVDIDDYDAACRGPEVSSSLYGCDTEGQTCTGRHPHQAPGPACPATSDELSCNVVESNAPRSATYLAADDQAGRHQPGIQTLPILYDKDGTQLALTDSSPIMVVPLPVGKTAEPLQVSVGGQLHVIDGATGRPLGTDNKTPDPSQHVLAMNLEDPRANGIAQNWTVTFEGAIPGFLGKAGELRLQGKATDGLYDPNSRFCDEGVHSQVAVDEMIEAAKVSGDPKALADFVELTNELPIQSDPYWTDATTTCAFSNCAQAFGTGIAPAEGRRFRIVEAYQDHVVLAYPGVNALGQPTGTGTLAERTDSWIAKKGTTTDPSALTKCCFPGTMSFLVRPGNQWTVVGDVSGFVHHVIADPVTGACRDSCDPNAARLNSRVLMSPSVDHVPTPDAWSSNLFANGAVVAPAVSCAGDGDCGAPTSAKVCGPAGACMDGCRGMNGNACGPGFVCSSSNGAIGFCGHGCSKDVDCGSATSGKVCSPAGVCVDGCRGQKQNGCAAPNVCSSNGPTIGKCGPPCSAESDCGGSNSGKVCLLGTTCVDGCRGIDGNGCPGDEVCSSDGFTPGVCMGAVLRASPFINPMFRFAITAARDGTPVALDSVFRFATIGSFSPLLISLAPDAKTFILPVGIGYVSSTGELAVTDGSINGLILVNLATAATSRSFF